MKKSYFSIILAFLLMSFMTTSVFAGTTGNPTLSGFSQAITASDFYASDDTDSDLEDDSSDLEDDDSDLEDDDSDLNDDSSDLNDDDSDLEDDSDLYDDDKVEENQLSQAAKSLKEQIDDKEDLIDEIEDLLEGAIEAGNATLKAELETSLSSMTSEINALIEQYNAAVQTRRDLVQARYTQEEIDDINEAINKILNADPKAIILSFDSIFSNLANFTFDTPPIIKDGRTLVPGRTITEGFGADVVYSDATNTVTITKDNTVITFVIGSDTSMVNGVEVSLDAPAEIINSRAYIPLRFILETLDLEVVWDDDTRTIEINAPDAVTATPSAIQ